MLLAFFQPTFTRKPKHPYPKNKGAGKVSRRDLCENSFFNPNPYKESISCRAGALAGKIQPGAAGLHIFAEVPKRKFASLVP
jgi:hypothetical protein